MNEDDQDDKNKIVPSDDQNDDLDQDLDDQGDQGNDQGDDDRGTQDDDQEQRQTRAERRRERFEAFQAARNGFQETDEQRQQALRRDSYNPLKYDKGVEYDVDELEKDRTSYGDNRYAQGVELQRYYDQQERYYDKIESDSDWVANKYSFLDDDSDDFDPELNKEINEAFFEAAGYNKKNHTFGNTQVRYKPFVQRFVRSMEKYAASRGGGEPQPRQRTGVQPTGGSRKTPSLSWKNPGEMTDDELKAHINAGLGIR